MDTDITVTKAGPQSCDECEGLLFGTRSLPNPHDYLAPLGQSETTGKHFFRCILCRTQLACEMEGKHWRWLEVTNVRF